MAPCTPERKEDSERDFHLNEEVVLPLTVGCRVWHIFNVAAGALDVFLQNILKREVLEDSDDVGEALVEGRHVAVAGLGEIFAQSIDESMRHFVSDDVVREAGENVLAGEIRSGILLVGAEVPEEQR